MSIIMLLGGFSVFYPFVPLIWFLMQIWIYFFFSNYCFVRRQLTKATDKAKQFTGLLASNINKPFLDFILINFVFFSLFWACLQIQTYWYFFNHLLLNNFLIYFSLLYTIVYIGLIWLFRQIVYLFSSADYNLLFAFTNFFFFSVFFFFCKNMLVFFFFLEILSALVFYQFLTTNLTILRVKTQTLNNLQRVQNKQLLTVLFFQYWASFFSSVFLLFLLGHVLLYYGTTDWHILNYVLVFTVISPISSFFSVAAFYNCIFFFFFFFTFFLKLGFVPTHLFKIEIYKGVSLITILIYNIFYFFIFFFFFAFITLVYFTSVYLLISYVITFIIMCGGLYMLFLLFDLQLLKAFFAYSTILNILSFLCCLIAIGAII